jgi:acetyltransferase-like isoleucine patch superfamily enzyme
MDRLSSIFSRYGFRSPVVVLVIALTRLDRIRQHWVLLNWRLYTRGAKGKRIALGRQIEVTPGSKLTLEDDIHIGSRCSFEISVNPAASVTIGSNTWISRDCCIVSCNSITIGRNVLIGELVSLRDTTHAHADATRSIKSQGDIVGSIEIRDDVWIGRGALILGRPTGTVIGRGAVIGANSVVTRSVAPYSVVAGAPARLIRMRTDSTRSQD